MAEESQEDMILRLMAEVVRERKRRRVREATNEAYQDWLETKAHERDRDDEN